MEQPELPVLSVWSWSISVSVNTENRKLWYPLRVSGCPYGRFPSDLSIVAGLLTTQGITCNVLLCLP